MLLLSAGMSHAANRYWVASSADVWNNTANWSTSSGGSGGASVPGSSDVAIFDRNGVKDCAFDMDISILGIDVQSGYTGTISQDIYRLVIGSSNASFADGTFAGGKAGITINGTCTLSGTAFTSTSGNLTLNGNFTYSGGSFAHNKGTVTVGAGITMTGSANFYYLDFSPASSATITVASGTTLQVDGGLIYDGTAGITVNTGQIDVTGDIVINNTGSGGGGSATININGSGSQAFSGNAAANTGRLCNVTINGAGTLTLSNTISMAGNWTYNTGTVDASTNAATVAFCATATVDAQGSSSNMSFYDVSVNAGTCTIGGIFTAARNVSISGGATLSNGSNAIAIGGNWSNSGTFTNTSGALTFNGSGTQTISKPGATETFYSLTINKSSGNVQLSSPLVIPSSLTLTLGNIVTTSSNLLTLNNGATCSAGSNSSYISGPVKKIGNAAFTFPLGGTASGTNYYHPLSISAPSSSTDAFTAEYLASGQTYSGYSDIDTSLLSIESCEHWTLARNAGTSTVTATAGWNTNSCAVTNYDDITLASWDGTKWSSLGASTITINSSSMGTIQGSTAVAFTLTTTPLVIGTRRTTDGYATLSRRLDGGYYVVSNGKLMFKFDEEYNDTDDKLSFNIYTDRQHNVIVSSTLVPSTVVPASDYGDNRITLNLMSCSLTTSGYLPSGYYILEVINEKGEKFYLRFRHVVTIATLCNSISTQ